MATAKRLSFASYKDYYSQDEDYDYLNPIKNNDVINFSFNKTKLELVYTMIRFKYNYNYVTEEYDSELFSGLSASAVSLAYNGYDDSEDNILEFESKYIRDDDTANIVWNWMYNFYRNQHLTVKLKLPLYYIDLEVGSTIKFNELLGGMKAFGIDYTKISVPSTQIIYPLFFITSINKNLDSIDIEAQQIPWIGVGPNSLGVMGWDEDLIEGDIAIEEGIGLEGSEEGEIGEIEELNMENVIEHDYKFFFPESTQASELINWVNPLYWGLNSFNQLIPTEAGNLSGDDIRDYTALKIHLGETTEGEPISLELKNISSSGNLPSLELDWVITNADTNNEIINLFEEDEHELLGIDSGSLSALNFISYGSQLIEAFNSNLLPISEGLLFHTTVPIVMFETGQLGDVTGDGELDILDIVTLLNIILGSTTPTLEQEFRSDVNKDGGIDILDVVMLTNHIMGTGDLG